VIIILFISVGILAVAAYVTRRKLKNAPVGYEDETGFHAIRCLECTNLVADKKGHQCSLGYTVRTGFFTGARPVDVCTDRVDSATARPVSWESQGKDRRNS
jgi:hypothetical protein